MKGKQKQKVGTVNSFEEKKKWEVNRGSQDEQT